MSQNPDLPIRRVAVTVPPKSWFGGVDCVLADAYRRGLVDLGIAVFDVPVDAFFPPDATRIENLIEGLKAFRPELVIGLPHGNYALHCRFAAGRDGFRPNLFCDVLDIPLLCLWDHAPLALADQLLAPHPSGPGASRPGAYESLRRVLTHPRLIHWSRDSGQTRVMRELGFVQASEVIRDYSPALPGFQPPEAPRQESGESLVAFVGNLYQETVAYPHSGLATLATSVVRTWIETPGEALWDLLQRGIAEIEPAARRQLALDPDQTYFWHYAHRLIVHEAQTASRLHFLRAARAPVACYGNLRDNVPGVPGNLVPRPGGIPFGAPLAAVLARHPVTIDVLNPGFISGFSIKVVLGFAAGGFLLVDRRQDFVEAFGDLGEAASYSDADELGAKLDRLLADPRYRREVGDAIRSIIHQRLELRHVLSRVLLAAAERLEQSGATGRMWRAGPGVTTLTDLLPDLCTETHWAGASVERLNGSARVSTPAQAWAYAATIGIPPSVQSMNQPEVRITLRVESGRLGLAVLDSASGALASEQAVSPSVLPVTVTIELPRAGASAIMLRNTVDMVSRALVLEVTLCDRIA